MRKLIVAILGVFTLSVAGNSLLTNNAFAAPSACKGGVLNISSGFIYKHSAPLRRGGPGTPLVGFRKEPTIVGVSQALSRSGTSIYDSKGNSIGRCPWSDAHDSRGGRYRCTMNTSNLKRQAQKKGGSPGAYFTLPGKKCVFVPNLGQCYGSSKGDCDHNI